MDALSRRSARGIAVTNIRTTRLLIVPAIGLLIIRALLSAYASPTDGTSDLLPPGDRLTALPITAVTIRDAFWAPRLEVSRTRTLDHVLQEIEGTDRKSTRLNSSHTVISYAVFCLKKK